MSNASTASDIQEGAAGATHLDHIRADILLRRKVCHETVRGRVSCRASIHLATDPYVLRIMLSSD